MKVTVFGASGRVGQLVVQKLLDDGHDVVGFVYGASPFAQAKGLRVVSGDIHSYDDVLRAVKGASVVVSTLGSWGTQQKDILSSGMSNIIAAMSACGVRRIVSLTGADAIAASDRPSFLSRVVHRMIRLSPAKKILEDGEKHIQLLEQSQLDWTVLRSPVMNTNGDPKRSIVIATKPMPWQTIHRQAVAHAIVDLIAAKRFYKAAPFIVRKK